MSIKHRIWSLPLIAIVMFSLGLAVSVYFSSDSLASIRTTIPIPTGLSDCMVLG